MRRKNCLLVAAPGAWRDSLHLLLQTIFEASSIGLTENGVDALQFVGRQSPMLIMVDFQVFGAGFPAFLDQLQPVNQFNRLMVFVEGEPTSLQLPSGGIDRVMLKWTRPKVLLEIIESLLDF